MNSLEATLRMSAIDYLDLDEGEYFDSMMFTRQKEAVKKYIKTLYEESNGDFDFVIWTLNQE